MIRALMILCLVMLYSTQTFSQGEWHMVSNDREKTAWASEEKTLAPPFTSTTYALPAPYASGLSPGHVSYSQGVLYIGFKADDDKENTIFFVSFQPDPRSV